MSDINIDNVPNFDIYSAIKMFNIGKNDEIKTLYNSSSNGCEWFKTFYHKVAVVPITQFYERGQRYVMSSGSFYCV